MILEIIEKPNLSPLVVMYYYTTLISFFHRKSDMGKYEHVSHISYF